MTPGRKRVNVFSPGGASWVKTGKVYPAWLLPDKSFKIWLDLFNPEPDDDCSMDHGWVTVINDQSGIDNILVVDDETTNIWGSMKKMSEAIDSLGETEKAKIKETFLNVGASIGALIPAQKVFESDNVGRIEIPLPRFEGHPIQTTEIGEECYLIPQMDQTDTTRVSIYSDGTIQFVKEFE